LEANRTAGGCRWDQVSCRLGGQFPSMDLEASLQQEAAGRSQSLWIWRPTHCRRLLQGANPADMRPINHMEEDLHGRRVKSYKK
jgi:hypothetical protein